MALVHLSKYLKAEQKKPSLIILKNSKHDILHSGSIEEIPEKFLKYYVLGIRRGIFKNSKTVFLGEDLENGYRKENTSNS